MKKENILMISLLIIIIGGLVFTLIGFFNQNTAINGNTVLENKFKTIVSNSKISIDLTPKGFNDGKLIIDMKANTHSGDLADYDLMKLIKLEYEGKSIAPSSVPKLSGHHSRGTLTFDIGKEINSFKIKIQNMPEIEERVFEW